MREGTRLVFDRRTHRQAVQRTTRLNYAFLAGQMLQDRQEQEITELVLDQLEGAQDVLRQAWGRFEWNRLAMNNYVLNQLDERLKARLRERMGEETFARVCDQPVSMLTEDERAIVEDELGWFDQNEAARQLLLSVISELWVDYLTSVEALRVSIGLEAYAQRDPLVQYKGRASEMFQKLLADVRMGVISRIFTYRPRSQAATITEQRPDAAVPEERAPEQVPAGTPAGGSGQPARPAGGGDGGKAKKKRKRH